MRVSHLAVALAAVSCVVFSAQSSSAQEEAVVTGPNRSLLSGGLFTFGIPYAASAIVAVESPNSADRHLFIPVAGPWLDLANRPSCTECGTETVNKVLLVGNGILQGLGALQIVGALMFPEERVVRTSAMTITITPASVGGSAPGLAAYGTF
jgi:hypothetical protein